jgi:hypothetical protein
MTFFTLCLVLFPKVGDEGFCFGDVDDGVICWCGLDLEEFFFAVMGVGYVFELVEEHAEEAGVVIGVRAVTGISDYPTKTARRGCEIGGGWG